MVTDIVVRLAVDGEWQEALDLANSVFQPLDLEHVLPLFFAPENLHNLAVATVEGHIVSLVGAIRFTVRAGPFVYDVAHVGSVCTHERWRGRGLASRLLAFHLDVLRSRGVDLVVISGQRGLYVHAGATPAGLMRWYTIAPQRNDELAMTPLTPANAPIAAAMWALEPVTIVRTPDAWRRGLGAWPDRAGWTRQAMLVGDPPQAYVVLDHAPNREGSAVRELAGVRPQAVKAAQHLAAAAGSAAVGVPVPEWDRALVHELASWTSEVGGWPAPGTYHHIDAVRTLGRLWPDLVPLPPTAPVYPQPGTYRLLDPLRTYHRLWPQLAQLDPAVSAYQLQAMEHEYQLIGPDTLVQGDAAWVCRLLMGADGRTVSPALPIPLPWWSGITWG